MEKSRVEKSRVESRESRESVALNPERHGRHVILNPEWHGRSVVLNPERHGHHVILNPEWHGRHVILNPERQRRVKDLTSRYTLPLGVHMTSVPTSHVFADRPNSALHLRIQHTWTANPVTAFRVLGRSSFAPILG